MCCLAMLAASFPGSPAEPVCSTGDPLAVRVVMADGVARNALLSGGPTPGLSLRDALSGAELWSAGADPAAAQHFDQMQAAFGHSLIVVDLDADGIHDRIYAGDRQARLWRFDLHSGASADEWASGGVFADLSEPGLARGFIAPPDVALIAANGETWFSLALGTATVGTGTASNRFYVIRDTDPFARWDQARYAAHRALTEADLLEVRAPAGVDPGSGYYIPLGAGQVLARSLTLGSLIHFTVAESSGNLFANCPTDGVPALPAPVSISVVRAADGALAQDLNGDARIDRNDLRTSLSRRVPASAGFVLPTAVAPGSSGPLTCSVAGELQAHCALDTAPRRTYWRREDAD